MRISLYIGPPFPYDGLRSRRIVRENITALECFRWDVARDGAGRARFMLVFNDGRIKGD